MRYLTFIFLLFSLSLQGQYILPSEEIDAIGCDERGNISFYKKGSRGMYIQCIIKVEKSADSNFLVPNWYTSGKERDVARITENYQLIHTSALRTSSLDEFEGVTFHTSKNILYGFNERRSVFQLLNRHMARLYVMRYDKKRFGFGNYTLREDDEIEKWRPETGEYYNIVVLDFGKGKYAYALMAFKYIVQVFFPLAEKEILFSRKGVVELERTNDPDFQLKNTVDNLHSNQFFSLSANGKKYRLTNSLGENLLAQTYDTIVYNDAFIIAKDIAKDKKGERQHIYNIFLKKLDCGTVKEAYLLQEQVEVLNEKGIVFYNIDGKEGALLTQVNYICGTVISPSQRGANNEGDIPWAKKVLYKHLERVSPSFYRFERNGKKGYLDIHTFKEYFDNK